MKDTWDTSLSSLFLCFALNNAYTISYFFVWIIFFEDLKESKNKQKEKICDLRRQVTLKDGLINSFASDIIGEFESQGTTNTKYYFP